MHRSTRIGIVGCGEIARRHLQAYTEAGGAEIVAVYDLSHAGAAAFAQTAGARQAASIGEMIERDRLDAVSVCTPPAVHLENCRPFLEAGIPVLCEKPLEINAERAVQLADAAKKGGAFLMPAFCHRFQPAIIELKKVIDEGLLGRPLFFRNLFGGYVPLEGNHRTDPKRSGGGVIIDNCSHSVDLFRHLVGEPVRVQAMGGTVMQEIAVEDFGMLHLAAENGSYGEISSSYSFKVCGNWVEWYGTQGTAIVSYGNDGVPDLAYRVDGSEEWVTPDCGRHPERFVGEIAHFLGLVRGNDAPQVQAADGVQCARVIDAAYQSAATGQTIAL